MWRWAAKGCIPRNKGTIWSCCNTLVFFKWDTTSIYTCSTDISTARQPRETFILRAPKPRVFFFSNFQRHKLIMLSVFFLSNKGSGHPSVEPKEHPEGANVCRRAGQEDKGNVQCAGKTFIGWSLKSKSMSIHVPNNPFPFSFWARRAKDHHTGLSSEKCFCK